MPLLAQQFDVKNGGPCDCLKEWILFTFSLVFSLVLCGTSVPGTPVPGTEVPDVIHE